MLWCSGAGARAASSEEVVVAASQPSRDVGGLVCWIVGMCVPVSIFHSLLDLIKEKLSNIWVDMAGRHMRSVPNVLAEEMILISTRRSFAARVRVPFADQGRRLDLGILTGVWCKAGHAL